MKYRVSYAKRLRQVGTQCKLHAWVKVVAEGTRCDMGGTNCICTGDAGGRDCECLAECPAAQPGGAGGCKAGAPACAVSSTRNKENNSNCGNACVLLCQTQCNDGGMYTANDCESATCSCSGSLSPFNNAPIPGNCCVCKQCKGAPPPSP